MKTRTLIWISVLLVVALSLSACGAKEPELPTPTPVDVNAVAVQAIQTFSMQLTMTAFANPTATATPVTPTVASQPTFVVLATNTVAAVNSCNNSLWIQDVTVPDGTTLPAGQEFTKTWLVKNTGTCAWTTSFKIAFAGIGLSMGSQPTPLPKSVAPGEQIEISIKLVAPTTAGDVPESYWKLQDDKGAFFGTWLTVKIKVAGAPAKTATPTLEPTVTP
jgi:predicted small lipoprotein YifL